MKLNLKKVALATTAAIGFSLIAAVPANATAVVMTVPSVTLTAAQRTISLGSTLLVPLNSGTLAATLDAAGTAVFTPTATAGSGINTANIASTTLTTTTNAFPLSATGTGALTITTSATPTGATAAAFAGKVIGSFSFTPTTTGTKTVTVTTTTTGALITVPTTITFDIVVVAAVDNWSVSANAIASGATAVVQTGTSNASTTFTSSGTPFTTTAADAGKIIIANEDGLIGTIATVTSTSVVELTAASPTQTNVPTAYWIGTPATTVVKSGVIAGAITGMSLKSGAAAAIYLTGNRTQQTVTTTTAKIEANGVSLGTALFAATPTDMGIYLPFTAPLTAGTYNTKITVSSAGTLAEATVLDFTLTVAASATLAPAASTSYMTAAGLDGAAAGAGTGAAASATTNAIPRTAVKTVGRSFAQIKVSLFKDDGSTDATANTVSCIISGVGFCIVNTTPDTYAAATARSATNSSSSAVRYVHVGTDGTAGTGTVTVSVTNASTLVETTLGTHTYTAYGDVAKLEVSTTNATIGKAATTTGGASATRVAAEDTLGLLGVATTLPAFIVKATDSAGRVANAAAVPTVTSGNGLAVVSGTCVLDGGLTATVADADYKSSYNGVGYYNCNFTGAANAVSGSKATLTISIADPADATKTIKTTLDVTIGGSVSTEVISFDKTSYAPGEGMLITRTAKDSAGNPVADGSSSPSVSFSKAVGGTSPVAGGFYKGGVSASSTTVAKAKTFAPTVPGAFSALATSGNAAASSLTASSSVTDANAGLLTQIDALNAKIVALNALIAKIMKKLGVK